MQGYNLIIIYDKIIENVLVCKRSSPPFQGKYNFIGGKIEKNENSIASAYREMTEESNISKENITLKCLMTLNYYSQNYYIDVYVGILNDNSLTIIEEKNKLYWLSLNNNFFDLNKFAGYGLIGHLIEEAKLNFLDKKK